MDYSFLEAVLFSVYFLAVIMSILFSSIIWKYLSKKALGMQTLLDFLIKDLIVLSYATLFVSTISTLGIGTPYHGYTAWSIICTLMLMADAMFIQNLCVLLTRYVYIFHPSLVASVDVSDAKFIKVSRLGNVLLSLSCITYEVMTQDFTKVGKYNFLTENQEAESENLKATTVKALAIANAVMIVVVRVKIEQLKDSEEQVSQLAYTKKTIRIISGVATLFVVIVLTRLYAPNLMTNSNTKGSLIRAIITVVVAFNFLPALMIFKNENMLNFAKKHVKSVISNLLKSK